ncbi:MAG: GAF domain-containing protein [Chloroflexi bacterium]|nr:GAF domain-containing protein [Chloroflexota bacterium]
MVGASGGHQDQPALPPTDLDWSPAFGLDEQQRILFWSPLAEAHIGVPAADAVGRPSYDVQRGRDFFGHPFCRKGCPVFTALLKGHPQRSCALELGRNGRDSHRTKWRLLALPPGSRPRAVAFFGQRTPDLLRLAQLGYVNFALSAPLPVEAFHHVLTWIAESTEMEVAELFLTDWQTHRMVLTAQRGPFSVAFRQITEFPTGQGYPGLVAAKAEPIVTDDLPHDPRFLRTRVKESGFTGYICVPLLGPEGVQGSLDVASRRRHDDLPELLSFLFGVSRPLSAAISTTMLRARDAIADVEVAPVVSVQRNLELMLRRMLLKMLTVTEAQGGMIVLRDPATGVETCRVVEGDAEVLPSCSLPPDAERQCPAWEGLRNVTLAGARAMWPATCRAARVGQGDLVCLPLVADERAVGVVSLRYRAEAPLLPTRHIAVLSAMAQRAAALIRNVQTYQRAWEAAIAAERERVTAAVQRAFSRSPLGLPLTLEADPTPRADPTAPALLAITCFGDFRVSRNGQPLSARSFARRQALTALKILLVHAGKRMAKEVLIEHLWPGIAPELGDDRLHVVMNALRHALEPEGRAPWLFVRTEGESYYWNTEAPYHLDVDEFRESIRHGEALERAGQAAQALAVYQAAAQVYRGDFMSDEPYSDWCWTEREFYRELYLGLIKKIAQLLQDQGDLERALEYYRQALQADPLREEIQRELMRCLWRARRRDEALRQYVAFRHRLWQELEVEPLQETQELYHTITRLQVPDR